MNHFTKQAEAFLHDLYSTRPLCEKLIESANLDTINYVAEPYTP